MSVHLLMIIFCVVSCLALIIPCHVLLMLADTPLHILLRCKEDTEWRMSRYCFAFSPEGSAMQVLYDV